MAAQLIDVPTPQLINLNIVGLYHGPGRLAFARAGAAFRELTLGRVVLDIDREGPRLTGLRYLRVHMPTSPEPTVKQLHAILSSSPGLEILDLSYWTSMFYYEPQVKELGPVLLPSLTALAVKQVPPRFLRMLMSCVQAPNFRYIRLPTISAFLFQDGHPLGELAKLCQGPLSTVSRLLISYDRATGSCTISHRNTDLEPQPNAQESPVKLARRRGVYLQTEAAFDPSWHDIPKSNAARLCTFIKEFLQPALCNIEIQLDLRNRWPKVTPAAPKSVVANLLNVPLVTHLRIHSHFNPMDVILLLSACQPIRTVDGEARQEMRWLVPRMETPAVACDPEDQLAVLESLDNLISNRGSSMHHGLATSSGQADERGDGTSHPPRSLKDVVVQHNNELPFQVWDSTQGWRAC